MHTAAATESQEPETAVEPTGEPAPETVAEPTAAPEGDTAIEAVLDEEMAALPDDVTGQLDDFLQAQVYSEGAEPSTAAPGVVLLVDTPDGRYQPCPSRGSRHS